MTAVGLVANRRKPEESNPGTASEAAPSVEFVKNQTAASQWTGESGPQPAVQYWAEWVNTGQQRLRFFVERIRIGNMIGAFNMMAAEKTPIGEFRDYVKGDNIYLTLITRTDTPDRKLQFWWGDQTNDGPAAVSLDTNYAVRVTVLADDGREQHFYFMLIPGRVNDVIRPEVLKMDIFGFPAQWEARDARR
jgi:hypothetical protein